jgi:hypothetical protein
MIKHFLSIIVFFFSTGSAFAFPVTGDTPVTNIISTPKAVVVDNSLVVFFQDKNDPQIGHFFVATPGANGHLLFEPTKYTLNEEIFKLGGLSAPEPVLLNNQLYVFGRSDENQLIYNAVDSLADLKNNNWHSKTKLIHSNTGKGNTSLNSDGYFHNQISAVEYSHGNLDTPDDQRQRRILLAFYEKNSGDHFTYSSCYEYNIGTLLICEGEKYIAPYGKVFNGAPLLVNEFFPASGNTYDMLHETPALYVRLTHHDVLYKMYWGPKDGYGEYGWMAYADAEIPTVGQLTIGQPGIAQNLDNERRVNITHLYYPTSISSSLYTQTKESSANWIAADFLPLSTPDPYGVETVVYNGRAYTFYVDKIDNRLKYYSDTEAVEPTLP